MARIGSFSGAKAVLAAAALVALTVSIPTPAHAQAPSSAEALSVSPPTVELDAQPGQKVAHKVTIENGANEPKTISVSPQNFAARGEVGQAELTEEAGPHSLSQWIKVTPATATIPAKEVQEFQVEINVPANASPGGHFGALVFAPGAPNAPDANVKVISQVTSLILLRIPGNTTEKAAIASFMACTPPETKDGCAKKTGFFQKGPVLFSTRIKNEGNVQVKPEGTITIYNIFGRKLATIPVDSRNVLPDSTRRFDIEWRQKQIFGQYKAKLELKYGANPVTIKSETSLSGAPVATVVVAGIALLGFFLLLWLPRKRIKKAMKALASSD